MNDKKQNQPAKSHYILAGVLQGTFKQAFHLKKNPFPYVKAIKAGLASALPILIGLICGNLGYGLLASLGGFTYLYVFNQPYAERARRIFFVMLGITLSVVLGTLLAPYPLAAAIAMGIVAAIPIFVFGALKITGPSAIFFVLTYAMTTGMPVDPSLAPLRGGLVLLGGALSWLICMSGWLVNPHGPETNAIQKVYVELAKLIKTAGTDEFNATRHRTVTALKNAEDTLLGGRASFTASDLFKRLFLLNEQANVIFQEVLELAASSPGRLPAILSSSAEAVAASIGVKTPAKTGRLPGGALTDKQERILMEIYKADAYSNEPVQHIAPKIALQKPSLKMMLLGAYDKNSVVYLTALRTGVIVIIAALIAISFDFNRSYWVPLSCAAVMAGSNFVGTFHRAVQRTIGTIVGLLVAGVILANVHNGYLIAFIVFVLTFLTETVIVRNYGLAAMFFTPAALVMAEYSMQLFDFQYFATVRITDIIVGSIIGLVGTVIVGRRLATSLLNHFISKTIRSQGQFLLMLFSPENSELTMENSKDRGKMQTNIINLLTVYNTALGELHSGKTKLEAIWPVIFSLEQLGYYLDASLKYKERPVLDDAVLSQLLYIFETMAIAVEHNRPLTVKPVPELAGFPNLQNEIAALQNVWHGRREPEGKIS